MLNIVSDHRVINDYNELSKDERSKLIHGNLPVTSLKKAVVTKILKDKLSDDEFNLVIDFITKETFESNSAGLQGCYYYIDNDDIKRYLDSSTIIVLNK